MSGPDLMGLEREAVVGVMQTQSLSLGPQLREFEERFAEIAGTRFAVGVSSGTAGLHLSVLAAGIGENDLVITTPFSFVASANVMLYERAVPVFVDVREDTGCIDPDLVSEAADDLMRGGKRAARWLPQSVRERTGARLKGVLPVDVFGQPADFDPIAEVAGRHGLTVIEDACEAVGAQYNGRPAGALGDISVFGFYPNKQMTTGEGGMIGTDREDWADLVRSLANQGREERSSWLDHVRLGYNYRLDELSAALGVAQLSRIDELLAKRAQIAAWYSERLRSVEQVCTPKISSDTTRMSWFVYVVRIEPPLQRDEVARTLADRGIDTRVYFQPIHLQPFYVDRFGYKPGDFPVAERLGATGLALPFSSVMSEDQVDYVCETLGEALS
jgi:dTDP-4-amino-4,6-dideoxygalactose transaminase